MVTWLIPLTRGETPSDEVEVAEEREGGERSSGWREEEEEGGEERGESRISIRVGFKIEDDDEREETLKRDPLFSEKCAVNYGTLLTRLGTRFRNPRKVTFWNFSKCQRY